MVCRKILVQQIIECVFRKNTALDAFDQSWARNVDHAGRVGHACLQGKIALEMGCGLGGHHEDFSIARLHAGRLDGGLDAHNGDIEVASDLFDACRSGRIACN